MPSPGIGVPACNFNYPHAQDYVLDQPQGHSVFVFIQMLTPCEIFTVSGMEQGGGGDCILYAPGHRQYNRATEGILYNNWLHLTGSEAKGCIVAAGIPLNRRFRLGNDRFIEPEIRIMREELLAKRQQLAPMLDSLARAFLIRLGRNVRREPDQKPSVALAVHAERLHRLRAEVIGRYREPWSIEQMAAMVNLSRSRFGVVYKALFGICPLEDLLRARLQQATLLLSSTTMTIERVAAESGFGSVIYFHRAFRRVYGQTPGVWRRRN